MEKTRREIAERLFLQGYNCTQAVVRAFADVVDADIDILTKTASSFGGGMGRLREVCGAVSGMFIIEGLLEGYTNPNDRMQKAEHYARIQALAAKFRDKNGSIVCRELLGVKEEIASAMPEERTPQYYKTRPCARLIGDAAEILEEHLREKVYCNQI